MKQRLRRPKRKDTEVPQPSDPTTNIADEAINEEMDDSLEKAATTATSLDAEQDRGGGPCGKGNQMGDTIAQTWGFENVSKNFNDPTAAKCGIASEPAGGIADIDADAGINLVSTHFDADTNMFEVRDLVDDEVVVKSEVAVKVASTIPVSAATTTTTVITDDEITLALKQILQLKVELVGGRGKGMGLEDEGLASAALEKKGGSESLAEEGSLWGSKLEVARDARRADGLFFGGEWDA
ncbi:hypothetical protein Tco_0774649 [Tanacetum coccineum]|uniref:Uncharacterized protein n=1 Tax=Tanacetum coccineum TaxID=301880 RepID=A0ABQ4ZT54_9ASTR